MQAKSTSAPARIEHPLKPVFDSGSKVLVLGTMPSPVSREVGFYYGHPQNRFWRVMAALFDEDMPHNNAERTALALRNHIALWDVLASCDIEGASDASIKNPIPNDLSAVIGPAPISTIATTGTRASQLFERFQADRFLQIGHLKLPSTSPANARMRLDDLIEAYQPLKLAARAPGI